jgi:hypothetical protein
MLQGAPAGLRVAGLLVVTINGLKSTTGCDNVTTTGEQVGQILFKYIKRLLQDSCQRYGTTQEFVRCQHHTTKLRMS